MKSKAPLALMEQLVMVLVFALAAALCVRGFVLSERISRRGEARDMAMIAAQNAAEALKGTGGISRRRQSSTGAAGTAFCGAFPMMRHGKSCKARNRRLITCW